MCLVPAIFPSCTTISGRYQVPTTGASRHRSWAVESFGSEEYPGSKTGNDNDTHSDELGREEEIEASENVPVARNVAQVYLLCRTPSCLGMLIPSYVGMLVLVTTQKTTSMVLQAVDCCSLPDIFSLSFATLNLEFFTGLWVFNKHTCGVVQRKIR